MLPKPVPAAVFDFGIPAKLFWHFLSRHFVCVGGWQKICMNEINLHNPVPAWDGGSGQDCAIPTCLPIWQESARFAEEIKLNSQQSRPARSGNQTK
jgi:hypothetical protein